ncbi:MAG: hypothetical protein GY941_23025 [Planctomycetes bacterium]|nr:hypothetical protein [Planctomycetota bacterium]
MSYEISHRNRTKCVRFWNNYTDSKDKLIKSKKAYETKKAQEGVTPEDLKDVKKKMKKY